MAPIVVVTGASGFVGRETCRDLVDRGFSVRAVTRRQTPVVEGAQSLVVGDIGPNTDWGQALQGADLVIHLAARVHVMKDTSADPLSAFRHTNAAGTERLARAAAAAGVRRLVFISSVKVNGEESVTPYTEAQRPGPVGPYALSKWEAEEALSRVAAETGLEVVILRPPLLYGPGVKANFASLVRLVRAGIPAPLASVRNRRSMVYVRNLVSAIAACLTHPAAAGQTYLVSDGEDLSTPDLMRRLAVAMGRPARLVPFPPGLVHWLGKAFGMSTVVERLIGSLVVDSTKIRRELGWVPPYSVEEGLAATVLPR